jgi:RHS repeat-associated protein
LNFNYREVETLVTKINKINSRNIFSLYHKSLPLYRRRPNRRKNILPGESGKISSKELDPETGFYYYGARYLDPRTSRWLSGDPALGDYIPAAPVNDEVKKNNGNLPGQGGVFNLVNLHVYHYAGNNPVKYVDPDGREDESWFSGVINSIKNTANNIYEKVTESHFEGRDALNVDLPTYDEASKEGSGWTLLSEDLSVYHQNETGSAELKYINEDGREAVYTKDFSGDDSYQLYTDPRYKGTYNYVTPANKPEPIKNLKDVPRLTSQAANFLNKGAGHVVKDVVPYYLTGKRNERKQ